MNSNAYVRARLVGNRFYGSDWKNITIAEMFHTLGMILKMSLVNIRLSGLKVYFNPIKKLFISCDDVIDLKTIETNWTDERLTYKHFLQIRPAIHPEEGVSEVGDKCRQLRAAIQFLNDHAKKPLKKTEKHAYSVMTSHPIYIRLQRKYELDLKQRKREEERKEECSDGEEVSDNDKSDIE